MNADLDHSIRHTLFPQDGRAQWSTLHSFSRVLRRLSRFIRRIGHRMSISPQIIALNPCLRRSCDACRL
jgi:hypothetical protein